MGENGSGPSGLTAQKPDVSLREWMAQQYHLSAAAMLRSISASDLIKNRQGFGQVIRPAKGSVLASAVIASYDPDPDYFFHWLRDSAVVIDALRILIEKGDVGEEGLSHFRDFLKFSLRLCDLDGGAFLRAAGDFRRTVDSFFLQYVRSDEDLLQISGDRVLGEPRFNPDGTLDILKWSRPQHDGPALRALALLRYWPLDKAGDAGTRKLIRALVERDLAFTLAHWREPSFDIWEEELGCHYYTRLVQRAALEDGAQWLEALGDSQRAEACRSAAEEIGKGLDAYWSAAKGFYLSRLGGDFPAKELDIAVILAVVHADRSKGPHSLIDPRVLATLVKLEELFAASYEINQKARAAPALGRYADDRYYSGGAYYFATLGAAEFYFALAQAAAGGALIPLSQENREILARLGAISSNDEEHDFAPSGPESRKDFIDAFVRRGDEFMATVRAYAPVTGELAEQFDQTTGAPASAKDLAWSHAAFITACRRRAAALDRAT